MATGKAREAQEEREFGQWASSHLIPKLEAKIKRLEDGLKAFTEHPDKTVRDQAIAIMEAEKVNDGR